MTDIIKSGFINVLKPPGMSSHDVIDFLRKTLKTKKIGHAGTLDPGAAGVLPVAVGRAAKFLEYLSNADKSYRAELLFGVETDSGDISGQSVASAAADFAFPPDDKLNAAIAGLTGEIWQTPPIYSAIKLNGQRAADLARARKEVAVPPRRVTISRLDLLAKDPAAKTVLLDIECSKGTYIRSLCRDIGRAVGLPATMSFLLRTRVGAFRLADSRTLEEIAAAAEKNNPPLEEIGGYLTHLRRYDLPPQRLKPFHNGLEHHDTRLAAADKEIFAVWCDGKFCGIGQYRAAGQSLYPVKLYSEE